MKSENIFGHSRAESNHSGNRHTSGSHHKGIEVPKVVKAIHLEESSKKAIDEKSPYLDDFSKDIPKMLSLRKEDSCQS